MANAPSPPRYPLIIRLGHWLNVAALVVMVGSGLQIFNAHPLLYAADASNVKDVVLSLAQPAGMAADGATLYTVNVAGHLVPVGTWGWDQFPPWLTLGGWLAGARRMHFAAALVFALNGLVYLAYMIMSRRRRSVWPAAEDVRAVPGAVRDHLRMPPVLHGAGGGLNPLQKIAYASVALGLAPFLVATGLALSPQWDAIVPFWTDLFGGRQFARTWHFLAMLGLVGFVASHIALVALSGPKVWRRMITGRVSAPEEASHG